MIGRLKDADDSSEYDKIVAILGVFHFFMELFKKTQEENAETAMFFGDVFLNAHVGKKVMANNIQYFLRLNDPTKPEKFVGAIISAIIAYAIQMMKKAGQHSARPASIHQFLIARSKQSAMAMSLFKCLCDYETVILVRRVERLTEL